MGKQQSGAKSYNVYGSLIMAVGRGPFHSIDAILIDGKQIFEGPVTRGGTDYASLAPTITAADSKWFHSSGKCYFFWGTQTQDIASIANHFTDHPNYRGLGVLVMQGLFFGRERRTAPNIQVIVTRIPIAPTELVAAEHNVLDDGNVNPVAFLAEMLTCEDDKLRLPVSAFEASDWLAAAATCAANKPRYFIAPLLSDTGTGRDVIASICSMFDGVLYRTPAGKLGLRIVTPGVVPGGIKTIDARHIEERQQMDAPGWPEVPTTIVATYYDRDRKFKQAPVTLDNGLALRARRMAPKPLEVALDHINRTSQASLLASEILRRNMQPAGSIELKVLRPHAAGLIPGSKVLVDVDPVPGGDGSAQLCIVRRRSEGSHGPVSLMVTPDTLVDAVPYSPTWATPNPDAVTCQPIDGDKAMALPLTQKGFGVVASVAALATRPDATVTGFRAFFDATSSTNDPDTWADLGTQIGFACRMTLNADVAEDADTFNLTMTDGLTGPDSYLSGRLPDNALDAQQDKLLLVIANVDADGVVVVTDGVPELEICSVVTRTNPTDSGATHDYDVLRSRRGTNSRAWASGDSPRCFIVPIDNVVPLTHPAISSMMTAGGSGYLRLRAYNPNAEADAAEVKFSFPAAYNPFPVIAWASPSNGQGTADGSGHYTPDVTVTDATGDLVSITITSRLTDGSGYVEHVSRTVPPCSSYQFNSVLTFAAGVHNLTVTARDRDGNTTTSTVQVTKLAGGALLPPTFDPIGPTYPGAGVSVTIQGDPAADRVQWVVASFGSAEPTSWPNETTTGVTDKTVSISGRKRIWARSKLNAGPNYSVANWMDYEPEGN